jgi:hypothetical protein
MISLLASIIVVATVLGSAIFYSPGPWTDDTDCTRIVQHTVRVLSLSERYTRWWCEYRFWHDARGTAPCRYRILLPPSKILNQTEEVTT